MLIHRRFFLPVFAALGLLAWRAEPGQAGNIPGLNCAVETANLVSVTIGNINKAPDINNILNFSCSFRQPLKAGRQVAYCWHIHDAPGGTTRFSYRYASLNNKNKVGFNIYSHEQRVGDRRNDYNIIGLATKITDTSYRVSDPITIRFEGNEGARSLLPGQYQYNNPQTHVVMHDIAVSDALNYRNACGAANGDVVGTGNKKGNTNITVNVRTYCNISVSKDMLFPRQASLAKPVKAAATVNTDCSAGTDYKVKLSNGDNYFSNMRHMKQQSGGEEAIAYSIAPEEWTGIGNGTPQGQDWVIDGIIPPQETPAAGFYKDRLVVTIDITR